VGPQPPEDPHWDAKATRTTLDDFFCGRMGRRIPSSDLACSIEQASPSPDILAVLDVGEPRPPDGWTVVDGARTDLVIEVYFAGDRSQGLRGST
jgi:hypothetical protein